MHILIVEDHPESASTLERLVRMHGHGSEIAPTMAQALASAALYHFDVALIDLGLPDGSGADLGPTFYAKGIRCIAVTGDACKAAELKEGSGFAAALLKPINLGDLAVELAFGAR